MPLDLRSGAWKRRYFFNGKRMTKKTVFQYGPFLKAKSLSMYVLLKPPQFDFVKRFSTSWSEELAPYNKMVGSGLIAHLMWTVWCTSRRPGANSSKRCAMRSKQRLGKKFVLLWIRCL